MVDAGFLFLQLANAEKVMNIFPKLSYHKSALMSYAIVAMGSFLFCSKGIFVKLMYDCGLSTNDILALRMSIALPFYLIVLILGKSRFNDISKRDWGMITFLSFIGYFLSPIINFTGLQYISIGLERVIFLSYPTLVLLGSILFMGKQYKLSQFLACILTWLGIFLMMSEEVRFSVTSDKILFGGLLIFLSALTFSGYTLVAKPVIERIGVLRYTSISMAISCLLIMMNFIVQGGECHLFVQDSEVLKYGFIIGIFGTVLPSYLLSCGLSRVSPSSYAVISSVGPVMAILLAIVLINEIPNLIQMVGIVLSLVASTMVSFKKSKT